MRRPQIGRPHYLLAALVFLTFWVSPVLAALLVPAGLLALKVYRRGQTVGFRRSRFWGVLGTTIAVWVGVPLALSLLPGAFGERGGAIAGAVTCFAVTLPLALLVGGLIAGFFATGGGRGAGSLTDGRASR
jgi:hypothetical protein